jgi:hypothetical protein
MTDPKPFATTDGPAEQQPRTIAAVLSVPTLDLDPSHMAVRPFGSGTLLEIALSRLQQVEADQRVLLSTEPEIAEHFRRSAHEGVQLVNQARLPVDEPAACTHLMLLGVFHPFLRPSSLSEAIRLFKMRTDILSLVACVRMRDSCYDESGRTLLPDGPQSGGVYRDAHAFQLVSRTLPKAAGQGPLDALDPYPFEISNHEAFFIDSEMEFEMASAWHREHAGRGHA